MSRKALPFALAYLAPATLVLGLRLHGPWTFATVAFVFVLTPLFDAILGLDTRNPDAAEEAAGTSRAHDALLWGFVPVQFVLIAWALHDATGGGRTPLEIVGLVLSTGLVAGVGGINVAHELMHRPGRLERALAELLMTSVTYPHFCVEHVHGHHKHVATPHDSATSRRGESLYAFLPRSFAGGLRSAWRIESRRVRERGLSGTLADRRLRYGLSLAAIYAALTAASGWRGALFFLAQGLVASLMLEIINYVEHYGLTRHELTPGRYERVRPQHSWNSPHRLTAWYLFNLPRHSDHHHIASRPYAILRHVPDSPQLPAGYSAMTLLALAPPLWRRVMDPRVARWSGTP